MVPLLLVGSTAHSESPAPSLPESFITEVWNREHGLPQISVLALAQDERGFIWLGTEAGLVRFDGNELETFDRNNTPALQSQYINALLAASDGGLWIGTESGLLLRRSDRIERFTRAEGLPHDVVQTLYEDSRGQLWVGTHGGLSRLRANTSSVEGNTVFESYTVEQGLPNNRVRAIVEGADGGIWVGTESGLAHLGGEGRVEVVSSTLPDTQVTALLRDRQDRLWIGTRFGLAFLRENHLALHPESEKLSDSSITSLFEDRAGALWIGTAGGGLNRRLDGDWKVFREQDGLPDNAVTALIEDREENLWVGTYLGGLGRLRPSTVDHFGAPEGLVDNIAWAILQDHKSRVWVGTFGGLTCLFPDGRTLSLTAETGLPNSDVRAILEDRDRRLWIGTSHGLARLDIGRLHTTDLLDHESLKIMSPAPALENATIRVLAESREGGVWVATLDTGIHHVAPDDSVRSWTRDDGLPSNEVRALVEDSAGVVWIGTDSGLARWERGAITVMDEPALREQVFALHADGHGGVWIGSTQGRILHVRDGEVKALDTSHGLPHHHRIHSLLTDSNGDFWVTSNDGVYRLGGDSLQRVVQGERELVDSMSFNESHGMRSSECNGMGSPSSSQTRDGRLWFACISGAVVIDPSESLGNPIPPPVHLRRVLVDQRSVDPSGPVELLPENRDVEFQFAALSYRAPERNRYRYRLEGFDEDWVESRQRSARYTNLDPGKYRFHVIAANNDGLWNEQGATVELTVRPAFFQTWVFWAACALSVLLGVHFASRRHTAREVNRRLKLQRIEALETQIFEMERFTDAVSHDLKSPLVTIRSFAEYADQGLEENEPEQAREDLRAIRLAADKMQRMLDELLELSRSGRMVNENQEIDAGELVQEVLQLLAGRIQAVGAEVVVAEDLPTIRGDRRRLQQVFQNLIDNAVKFSSDQESPKIEVGVRFESEDPIFFIRDQGVGIPPEQLVKIFESFHRLDDRVEGTGLGLAIVKRVVEAHGGAIWADSEGPDSGATFSFTLPGRPENG